MTILHLIQKPQLRGAEIFAAQLANHTHQIGHKAILVSLFPGDGLLPFDGKMINLGGSLSHRLWNVKAWRRLAQIIKAEKPDIVQANAGDTLKYAVFSKLIFRWKQPIVFRNASTISLYIRSWPAKVWNSFLFRHTAKIISVSKTSANDFSHVFPVLKNRITVVPIGIEEWSIAVNPGTGLKNGGRPFPELIHVGGFTYEKNHVRLIAIFRKLLLVYPHACLRLIGDGPLRQEAEEVARKAGLHSRILFYGAQKEVLPWISRADVLLLPSIIEGLPGVILEAFYCKVPVVAYDVGGIKEVLINNRTGHLVTKGDEDAFVNAIIDVIRNEKNSSRMAENAYRLVVEGYLNKLITKQFIEVYETVVRHNPL